MADREVRVKLRFGEYVLSGADIQALPKQLLKYLNRPKEYGNSATE